MKLSIKLENVMETTKYSDLIINVNNPLSDNTTKYTHNAFRFDRKDSWIVSVLITFNIKLTEPKVLVSSMTYLLTSICSFILTHT